MSNKEKVLKTLKYLAVWTVYAVIIGIVVGLVGFAFDKALEFANEFRGENKWLLFLMPVAGVIIVAMYRGLGVKIPRGTNRILKSAEDGEEVALRVAPMIFAATTLTHMTGGSAGREGAALQLGGSIANFIGRLGRKLSENSSAKGGFLRPDLRIITMCGMAAGFSALFGAPLASAVFALEVTNNVMRYAALYPSMMASITAAVTVKLLGGHPMFYAITEVPDFAPDAVVQSLILGALVGLLAILFVFVMEKTGELYAHFFKNQYLRVLVGAALVIGLSLLEGSGDYNGAGGAIINRALEGDAVWYAFILKIVFTALTLGAGFKGGEIVPILFTGATFGCVVGTLLGLPAGFAAGLCMMALFCGATNCPLASIFLAYELFQGKGLVLCALAITVSYLVSGRFSLYTAQKLSFSKLSLDGEEDV